MKAYLFVIFFTLPLSLWAQSAKRCTQYLSAHKISDIEFVQEVSTNEWLVKAVDTNTKKIIGLLEASSFEPGKITIDIVYINEAFRGIGVAEGIYRRFFSLIDPKLILSSTLATDNEKAFVEHYKKISDPLSPLYKPELTEQQRYREALNYTPEFKVKRAHGYTKVVKLNVTGLGLTRFTGSVNIDVEVAKE